MRGSQPDELDTFYELDHINVFVDLTENVISFCGDMLIKVHDKYVQMFHLEDGDFIKFSLKIDQLQN